MEGKGNGIKTVVVNAVEVAKALSRPATYPIKFFGCELGAQTQFDIKHDRYIVNGSHDANRLQVRVRFSVFVLRFCAHMCLLCGFLFVSRFFVFVSRFSVFVLRFCVCFAVLMFVLLSAVNASQQ